MNAGFVNVKVDREERPDVDAVYMAATQALTGQGGWPMTVFLTPQGRPFYAGTYFPPAPRHGMPSFPQVLQVIGEAWRTQREEVEAAGGRISAALAGRLVAASGRAGRRRPRPRPSRPWPQRTTPSTAASAARRSSRRRWSSSSCCGTRARDGGRRREAGARAWRADTLRAMARGGIYDQLAGGFARYSVDAGWVVPHFEKMLYDNALLAAGVPALVAADREPTGPRVALETCDWMVAALRTAAGRLRVLARRRHARRRRHGVEGSRTCGRRRSSLDVLGDEDAAWAGRCSRSPGGHVRARAIHLQLARDVWLDAAGAAALAAGARPARRRRAPPAAGPGRQGRRRVERAGRRRARRDRRPARPAGPRRRRGRAADLLLAVHLTTPGRGPTAVRAG